MRLDPYLNFAGKSREAMEFYQSVFGGKLEVISFRDFGGAGMPEAEQDLVMHASISLPNGDVLMCSDVPSSMGGRVTQGDSTHVMIGVDSVDEAVRVYDRLSEGGEVHMELAETDWAERYANFKDRYGIHWMVFFAGSKSEG